jgi:energy-coupling factor transporter transmembrane protein EcfT
MNENREQVVGLAILFLILSFVVKEHLLVVVSIIFLMGLLLKLDFVFSVASLWHRFFVWIVTALSTVFLTIVFYTFITPYSFIYRIMQRKSIREYLRGPSENSSYFNINKKYDQESFKKPW